MISKTVLVDETECTGCTACYSVCPSKAITMIPKEGGFFYPSIDEEKCVGCDMCRKKCPLNKTECFENGNYPKAFIFQNISDDVRRVSSSGGAFSAIAQTVINNGGIVYGAKYDENFKVVHTRVSAKKELPSLYGSKYVQSYLGDVFSIVNNDLKEGRTVLFCGTPCQVAGLIKVVGDSDNLLTVDFACHGVPSPKIYDMYLLELKNKYKNIKKISFRNKKWGYAASTMGVTLEGNRTYTSNKLLKSYKKMYFDGLISRESCYKCSFKALKRESDITLFDCWSTDVFKKEWDDDKGTSYILIHSFKGERIVDKISNQKLLEVDVLKAVKLDGIMLCNSDIRNPKRTDIVLDSHKMTYKELLNKYGKLNIKECLATYLKPFLYKTGFIKKYKRIKSR